MSGNTQFYDSASSTSSPISVPSPLSEDSETDYTSDAESTSTASTYLPSGRGHYRSQYGRDAGGEGSARRRANVDLSTSVRGSTKSSYSPNMPKIQAGSRHTRTLPGTTRVRQPRSRSHHRHDDPGMPRLHICVFLNDVYRLAPDSSFPLARDFLLIIGLCITLACAVVLVTRPAIFAMYEAPFV
jgi:hypothetical protein